MAIRAIEVMQSMSKVSPPIGTSKSLLSSLDSRRAFFVLVVLVCVLMAVLALAWFSPSIFGGVGLEVTGNTILVKRGGDFQAALNRAQPGDTISLEAGATFKGAFKLPKKSGSQFITIRSSALDAQLPPPGVRIDPAKYEKALPKIQSDVRGEPAILGVDGAHHYRFVAVQFGPTIEGLYNIIQLGTGEEMKIEDLPHHIEFDRVYIHGDPVHGQRRGIAANGRNIRIENSHISEIKRKGDESQAIAAWATDGPIEIINNYLEAAAENILFGGAGSKLKLVPTDCIVRDNHLNKPLEWRNADWVVKNLFEIKNGRRIKVENNLMTNNWAMGQDGMAILFTTRADNGRDTIIEDIEFTGNIIRGAGGGINILGEEGAGGHRLVIRNNLFEDISGPKWGSAGHFLKIADWDGLTIENNTILQTGNITSVYGKPVRNFVFRGNIVFENEYGIKGDNMGSGQEVIDFYFSKGLVSDNVIIGGSASRYRERNFYPGSVREVGFANPTSGDYRLAPQSPYINKGTGGTSIGAQLNPERVGRRATK